MTVKVVYPVPNESDEVWDLFRPFVERFTAGWHQFPPGCDCELVPVLFADDPTGKVSNLFTGLPVDQFELYQGGGCDIGASQWVADASDKDDFIVSMTSRVFFHRAGWLNHLMVARELYGKGLYGCFASREGGKLHIGTRGYAMDASMWQTYPHHIGSRDQGTFFEVGANNPIGSLTDWVLSIGLPALVVYWDGVRPVEHALVPENIFRRGNQENCLVFDRHTQAYHLADDAERRRLSELCYGLDTPVTEV